MLFKLPRCLSDVRAPLVEDLGPPELEKTCCIFSTQITEKSKKISRKCYKFSVLKDFFVHKYVLELEISN